MALAFALRHGYLFEGMSLTDDALEAAIVVVVVVVFLLEVSKRGILKEPVFCSSSFIYLFDVSNNMLFIFVVFPLEAAAMRR